MMELNDMIYHGRKEPQFYESFVKKSYISMGFIILGWK